MRFRLVTCAIALAAAIAAPGAAAADDIKLSGCLVRGQDGDGYLLTNVPGDAAWQRPGDAIVAPGPVGTSGTVASVLYWLEKKDGLADHVVHYVEIEADGKSMKAQVPRSVLIIPDKGDSKLDVLVRRVEPQRIKMLAAVCGR